MNDDWLRDCTDVPDHAVEQLHARVVRGVAQRNAREEAREKWMRRLMPASVVAALFFAYSIGWTPEQDRIEVAFPTPPPAPEWAPVIAASRPRQLAAAPRPVTAKAPPVEGAAFVRLETADPDIVIYLIADGGDE
ncbi:MAG: hypothetical protein R2762_30845 [Bryobacteraceae bacterium]